MKSTIIEGVEYKLTPIKKENKTIALFILTMPKTIHGMVNGLEKEIYMPIRRLHLDVESQSIQI